MSAFNSNSMSMPSGNVPPKAVVIPSKLLEIPKRTETATQITHAWSIGTTRAATDRPAPRRKEECPPEVYIG